MDRTAQSPFRPDGFVERFLDALVLGASLPGSPEDRAIADAGVLARWAADQADHLEWLYEGLDPASRDLMVRLFAHAALGPSRVRLPLGGEVGRTALDVAQGLAGGEAHGWTGMRRYELGPVGIPVALDADVVDVVGALMLVEHRPPLPARNAPRVGDVVLDATAGVGARTLQLASAVGAAGHVHAFEPDEILRELLVANLALNFDLAARVRIEQARPGSRMHGDDDDSVAIDDLVADGTLDRVDFARIALAGRELDALVGAARTLEHDRPCLAVWLDTSSDDWIAIPRFLDGIGVGYRFSLGHTFGPRPHPILFASAPRA